MQNTSHAVMAQRAELRNSLDDFPTPPWATRALIEHVIASKEALSQMSCLEPACGRGHMAIALAPYFRSVGSFDDFKLNPPSRFAQFTERVPMVKGRVDKKASTATGYVACTRFRRHRVRCFDGAGGGSWRDGSLRGSSSLRLCA